MGWFSNHLNVKPYLLGTNRKGGQNLLDVNYYPISRLTIHDAVQFNERGKRYLLDTNKGSVSRKW